MVHYHFTYNDDTVIEHVRRQLLEEMVEDLTGQDPTTLSAFQKRLERQGYVVLAFIQT